MLRKGVYSYEYMDDWEKFSETSLPENEDFTVTLTWKILLMQIMHTEKEFVRILNLREYHEVYVQNNTLFLADVFENLWNMSSGIRNLPSSFFIALGLAWQGAFKKTKAKLDFWTNTDKLLMVKKEELCHSIHRYAKANNKYMKHYNKKESSYLKYWDANNLYGWAMTQTVPANKFKRFEDISEFNPSFRKNYKEESDEGYFKLTLNILKIYITFTIVY